jgi:hypothetical protein
MKALINDKGITIRDLKNLVKDLPDLNEDGENFEVWVEHTNDHNLSTVAKSIIRLNKGDIIVSIKS